MNRAIAISATTALLAGCGGGDDKKTSTSTPAKAATTAKPADAIGQMQGALRSVHSYHVDLSSQGTKVTADWDSGRVRVHIEQASGANDAVVTPDSTYVRGDKEFWQNAKLPPAVAAKVAGRWVKVPIDDRTAAFVKKIDPESLAYCAGVDVGTTKALGDGTVNGVKVHKLEFVGDVPGSSPGTVEYAAEGPAYPVRLTQTGKRKPGGTTDPRCESGSASAQSTGSVTEFSRFNEPISVKEPADALTLDDVRSMAQDGSDAA